MLMSECAITKIAKVSETKIPYSRFEEICWKKSRDNISRCNLAREVGKKQGRVEYQERQPYLPIVTHCIVTIIFIHYRHTCIVAPIIVFLNRE